MAWRPVHLVKSGEIDNTQLGWTTGWIELEGFEQPLQLKLIGNCHPDLAGWRFRIHRIEPEIDLEDRPKYTGISLHQSGHVGDITADQMIKHLTIPAAEFVRRLHAGENPPFQWRKCLYLEWFSNSIGRVVIQSTRLEVERLGERAFELTEAQWREQANQNWAELDYFMVGLDDSLQKRIADGEEPDDD